MKLHGLGTVQHQKLWRRYLSETGLTVTDEDVAVLTERVILAMEQDDGSSH